MVIGGQVPGGEARFDPVIALLAHERLTAEQVRYLPEVLEVTVAALVAHARPEPDRRLRSLVLLFKPWLI
ncbi:hypothetical protein [Streptomyces pseudovenezuelae]|uniref:hypothetical protein n=1 Tax=Streptomyces pseudovenezuelae TaxID=67350 RepID=UPI002E2EEB56|nr:hypothetical protein [Streptomyces pseudovenezuelae]